MKIISRWQKLRLHIQLAIIGTSIIAITLIIGSIITANKQVESAYQRLEKESLALAKNIVVTGTFQVINNDLSSLEELLIKSAEFPGVKKIQVLDIQGTPLGHVEKKEDDIQAYYDLTTVDLSTKYLNPKSINIIRNPTQLEVWLAIRTSTQIGWLWIVFDTSQLTTIRNNIWRNNILTSIYAIVFNIIILVLVLRLPMRALRKASDFALHLDNQKGKQLFQPPGSFELKTLIDSLNQASATIHQQHTQIEQARSDAEQANIAKSQFLANMSHEIRTPMNGVLGTVKLLAQTPLNEAQQKYVHALQISGRNLLVIINDILDFSKIEAEKIIIENTQTNLREFIDSIISNLHAHAKEKNVTLSYSIHANTPSIVNIDITRMSQVLNNLLHNAIKFSENKTVHLNIACQEIEHDSATLIFSIIDTGLGIEAHIIPSLFSAFIQADASTTRKFGGSGLGLAICKRLVELMGGEIHVESRINEGSTFTVSLPTTLSALDHGRLDTQQDIVLSSERNIINKDLKILVVEDNPVNQMIAEEFIASLGLRVDLAENGQVAIDLIKDKHYDLVFMDMQMPVMDGIEATHLICARYPPPDRPIIIALTANALPSEIEKCYAAGMNDYLAKPLDMDKLFATIHKWSFEIQNQTATQHLDESKNLESK